MTPREIELSHQWQVWHRAMWQHELRMTLRYHAEVRPDLWAQSAENSEWHLRASRAHARLVGKRGAP